MKNELPVAVHLASGGDARLRKGGTVISLDGISSGSFQLQGATRYRALVDLRTNANVYVVFGYTSPLGIGNAAFVTTDLDELVDAVADGTTVYFRVLDDMTLQPEPGSVDDYIHVSYYG